MAFALMFSLLPGVASYGFIVSTWAQSRGWLCHDFVGPLACLAIQQHKKTFCFTYALLHDKLKYIYIYLSIYIYICSMISYIIQM
jgi:hypothetical protein